MYEWILLSEEEQRKRLFDLSKIKWGKDQTFYNKITELAAYICQTPIGLLTLVLEDTQQFKGSFGVNITETPIKDSICKYTLAIKTDTPLYIPNILDERIFDDNELVIREPKIRFYCGIPVRTEHLNIGALCVIDVVPRELTKEQIKHLTLLADIVCQTVKYVSNK